MSSGVASASGTTRVAPSPPASFLLGHARQFKSDPPNFLLNTARDFGPVVRLKVGPLTYHLINDAALVTEVLQDRAPNFVRDTRSSRNIRLVTGESLLTAEGETWRRHRRLAQPMFHPKRVGELGGVMARAAAETADAWARAARNGEMVDLAVEMSRLTFTAVGRCLFGLDLAARASDVENALPVLLSELFYRSQHPAAFPIWLPFPRHRQFSEALQRIDDVVDAIIIARRRQSRHGEDLLGLLLDARDDDGASLTDAELRDQIVTFLLAGHETTASLLTWTLALLAQNPAEREAVEHELDRGGIEQRGVTTVQQVMPLTRLTAVLQEALRLYPSIWITERRVVADDQLGGFEIPANTSVIVSPFVMHRSPAHWPEPEVFRPERFLGVEPRTLLHDGYFPFGAGPHLCIGQHFAMLEAKLILATLASRFRVHLVNGALPTATGGITLRPAGAVPVRLEPRRGSA
ncbi:MAG: cytochrome P450 [Opitutus sp.]